PFWWSALTRSHLFYVRNQPACALVAGPPRRAVAEPDPETIRLHDRAAQASFEPGGILLENQDVGGDVQRRMGKPVRRLRALLPGKARGRGYRQNLLHPCVLQAARFRPMRLQGLPEPFRQGSGLCPPDARERPHSEL